MPPDEPRSERDPVTHEGDDQAGELLQRRGSFLGFVAHEIRNPLSTALWSAELLVRLSTEDRAGPRGEKLAGMCLRSLQRLRLLVEDHFLADRLGAGGMPLRAESVALGDLLGAVASKVGLADVSLDVEDHLSAWVDRGLAERALEGLLAVAGRGKVPVHVAGSRNGDRAELRVRGAPPAPDALEPPQKGTPSDSTGRALSLHMAVNVARALGGSLATAGDAYLLSLPSAPGSAVQDET